MLPDSNESCVGIPFASRFRSCVRRVAGTSILEVLELLDHKVRNIHSAKGPKACFQSLEVSESWAANSPVSRQLPSLSSKNHFRCNDTLRNQSNRKPSTCGRIGSIRSQAKLSRVRVSL